MRRRWFLVGVLCGLLLGVLSTTLAAILYIGPSTPVPPKTSSPIQAVILAPERGRASVVPQPGWERHYFNGQPYYLIPLASEARS